MSCSIKPDKKGKHASMKECAEKKQIRYYGVKKIDQKTLDLYYNKKSSKKNNATEKRLKLVRIYGELAKLEKQITREKDDKKKDKIQKQIDELNKKRVKITGSKKN